MYLPLCYPLIPKFSWDKMSSVTLVVWSGILGFQASDVGDVLLHVDSFYIDTRTVIPRLMQASQNTAKVSSHAVLYPGLLLTYLLFLPSPCFFFFLRLPVLYIY